MNFEDINVQGNDEAQAELQRRGIPRVPATLVGDEYVHGWNPEALARLVGIAGGFKPLLNPQELQHSLDRILSWAQHGLDQAPDSCLLVEGGGRKRSLRQLGFHIFSVSLGFLEAMRGGRFEMHSITREAPEDLKTGPDIARFGAGLREELQKWFAQQQPALYETEIDTYYGPVSVHGLLERTTWHAGQHTRQIYALLEGQGVLPPNSLDDTVFEGLPMPEQLW